MSRHNTARATGDIGVERRSSAYSRQSRVSVVIACAWGESLVDVHRFVSSSAVRGAITSRTISRRCRIFEYPLVVVARRRRCPAMESSASSSATGVRLVRLNLPEDEGEGLGFRLTRTLWDPYPWVRDVSAGSRAAAAGLRAGDCVLRADGADLLGLPVGRVAALVRADGCSRAVELLVWSCGVDPNEDPELLWSCGGGSRGERSRRALGGVVRALACCVCAATASDALSCARSHLYCAGCWSRLQRCALCREPLPATDSPYSKNLVAEQVFEAIAAEYEIKTNNRNQTSRSAYTSPVRSPATSPATSRKGRYQISVMKNRRMDYASDPNINNISGSRANSTHSREELNTGNTTCQCQCQRMPVSTDNSHCLHNCQSLLQHKLVARLRPACSLADLQYASVQPCTLSKSLNNINLNDNSSDHARASTTDDTKTADCGGCTSADAERPLVVLTAAAQPLYLLACDHGRSCH